MKKRNRKLRKVLLVACSALILVCISVGATIAYLTDHESVTNTFTVGKVGLKLDEAKVNLDGTLVEGADRVKANSYHLIPGETYTKDPTVHVDENSDPCWLFVKVENGLADIEAAGDTTIAKQLEKYEWKPLSGVPNVYYQKHESKSEEEKSYKLFDNFTLKGEGLVNGTAPQGYTGTDKYIGDYEDAAINITAYAIQAAGFENDPAAAWTAGNWAQNP